MPTLRKAVAVSAARSSSAGVSLLLEMLLGLGLITVAILTLFVLFPSSEKAVRLSDDRTQALHLARRLLEQKLALNYADLVVGEQQATESLDTTLRRGVRSRLDLHSRVQVSLGEPAEVKDIRVTVWWADSNPGGESQVVLSSSKGKYW